MKFGKQESRKTPRIGGTPALTQNKGPDRFFSAQQQRRLEELMQRWRTVRDAGKPFSASEQAELNALVEAEVQASGVRATVPDAR